MTGQYGLQLGTGEPPSITLTEAFPPGLVALLARFRYRPGWTFTLHPTAWGCSLRIVAYVQDARAQGPADGPGAWASGWITSTVKIASAAIVPDAPDADEGFWLSWLREMLVHIEMHELGEWFTVDGERPFDPHRQAQ